jgi:hypothetical protein
MADVPLESTATTATTTAETPSSSPASTSSSAPATDNIARETAAAFQEAEAAASRSAESRETPPPAQPATQADGLAATPAPDGRLPLARHKAILEETRAKADREIAEIRQKFAWADKVTPQQVEQGTALINWLQRDPAGAIDFLQRQHQRTQPAPAPEPPRMPEPDVELGDGSRFYSAQGVQQLLTWQREQIESGIDGRYGPMLQEAALAKLQAQTDSEARQGVAYYRETFPLFKDLEKDIKALALANPHLSIEHAYALVYADKGRAKERENWEAERAGRLQTKAAASTVAPGMPRPMTPKADRDKSIREITMEAFAAAG